MHVLVWRVTCLPSSATVRYENSEVRSSVGHVSSWTAFNLRTLASGAVRSEKGVAETLDVDRDRTRDKGVRHTASITPDKTPCD